MKTIIESIKTDLRKLLQKRKFRGAIIHDDVNIDDKSELGKHSVIFKKNNIVKSKIDDYTYIQENSRIYYSKIGKFCSIAPEVVIGLLNHPIKFVSTSPVFYDKKQPLPFFFNHFDESKKFYKETVIGPDCWIGQRSMIMSGLTVGVGAIIAAGSVVTRNVEPYSIVAGIPAKKIKMRFSKPIIIKLIDSNWWKFSDEKLQKLSPYINDPKKFLNKLNENN